MEPAFIWGIYGIRINTRKQVLQLLNVFLENESVAKEEKEVVKQWNLTETSITVEDLPKQLLFVTECLGLEFHRMCLEKCPPKSCSVIDFAVGLATGTSYNVQNLLSHLFSGEILPAGNCRDGAHVDTVLSSIDEPFYFFFRYTE